MESLVERDLVADHLGYLEATNFQQKMAWLRKRILSCLDDMIVAERFDGLRRLTGSRQPFERSEIVKKVNAFLKDPSLYQVVDGLILRVFGALERKEFDRAELEYFETEMQLQLYEWLSQIAADVQTEVNEISVLVENNAQQTEDLAA